MLPFNRPFEVAPLKMAGVTKIRSAVEGLKRKSVTASIRHRRQALGGGRGVWGGGRGGVARELKQGREKTTIWAGGAENKAL